MLPATAKMARERRSISADSRRPTRFPTSRAAIKPLLSPTLRGKRSSPTEAGSAAFRRSCLRSDRRSRPTRSGKSLRYLRTFCTNPHWPRGELNLPRALVTEKAFPESEEVISTSINAQGAPGVETHYIHEQRFGIKNQIEIDVPINFADQDHIWYGGVGDVTFGYKREIYSSLQEGEHLQLVWRRGRSHRQHEARLWQRYHDV